MDFLWLMSFVQSAIQLVSFANIFLDAFVGRYLRRSVLIMGKMCNIFMYMEINWNIDIFLTFTI